MKTNTFKGLIPEMIKKLGGIGVSYKSTKMFGMDGNGSDSLEVVDVDNIINTKKVNDIIKEDYKELYAESSNLIYWESHITLNKNLEDAKTLKDLKPMILENIFEIYGSEIIIYRTTNLNNGEKNEVRKTDEWYESHKLYPEDFVLTIEDALKIYWKSDYKTTGNKITMRRPINPVYTEPYYIFGQLDSDRLVWVNAVTGEISITE